MNPWAWLIVVALAAAVGLLIWTGTGPKRPHDEHDS